MIPPSKPHRYAARTLVEVEKWESECMSRKALTQCANCAFITISAAIIASRMTKEKRVSGIGSITALQRTAQHHRTAAVAVNHLYQSRYPSQDGTNQRT